MSEVVGISAGRKHKVTESLVKAILEGTGKEYALISLSGTLIRPCEACGGCVNNNQCVLRDDFQPILEKCFEAQSIVFGAPRYWNHTNAKGQAFWERACFSGRHHSVFPLQGKLGVIAAVAGSGDGRPVVEDIEIFFDDAKIHALETIAIQGEYVCFTCGSGSDCPVGGFVELFPLGTRITREIIPSLINQHPNMCNLKPDEHNLSARAREIGRRLGRALEARQTEQRP